MSKRPVLLDWDDHLVNSEKYYNDIYEATYDAVKEQLGLPKPAKTYKDKGDQKAEDYYNEVYNGRGKEVMAIRREIIFSNQIVPELKEGAKELLAYLRDSNTPHAIVSDTPQEILENNVAVALEKLGIESPLLVGRSDTVQRKPSADGINYALELLGKDYPDMDKDHAIMLGDKPDKDAAAARNAGIQSIIIPDARSGDFSDSIILPNLATVKKFLEANIAEVETIQSPKFVMRQSYAGVSEGKTKIIAGEQDFIESPTLDAFDSGAYSAAEREFHNLRWIAKRAVNLDLTGKQGEVNPTLQQKYSREEQMEAASKIINGFTAEDGTEVQGLLTQEMIQEVLDRVLPAVEAKRQQLSADEPIVVHFPERIVFPRKDVENMLSVAYNVELMQHLQRYFDEHHPELHVSFSDEKLLKGLSLQKAIELNEQTDDLSVLPLSKHDLKGTAQSGRSTGTLLDRIVKQPIFDYSDFNEGDLVVLTDDHVQAGGTFITWWHALQERGVDVLAVTALSTMPESKNLQPPATVSEDIHTALSFAVDAYMQDHKGADREKITARFDNALEKTLARVGLSVDTLSNREALTMIAYLVDGQQPEQLDWFQTKAQEYGADLNLHERKGESLLEQAAKPSVSPVELQLEVENQIPRYAVSRAA